MSLRSVEAGTKPIKNGDLKKHVFVIGQSANLDIFSEISASYTF